jgi:hypothetical protein
MPHPFSWLTACLCIALVACASHGRDAMFCAPPERAEAIWRNPQIKYVVLGEHHGTAQMPAATAEIACAAAADGSRVLLALEVPAREEAALQRYVAGEIDAATMIRGSGFWERGRDGRNSIAMLAMLERVRILRTAGLNIEVIAVAPSSQLSDEQSAEIIGRFPSQEGADMMRSLSDLRMAAAVIDGTARNRAERTIFLVGNAHAVIHASPSSSLNIATREVVHFVRMHAAAALPREQTLSLVFTDAGGTAFAQARHGAGEMRLAPSEEELGAPRVVIEPRPADRPRYDGRIFVGAVTASPPVALPLE